MINKWDPASRSSDFVNHFYDYRPNWTPLSPVIIINHRSNFLCAKLIIFQNQWRCTINRQIFKYERSCVNSPVIKIHWSSTVYCLRSVIENTFSAKFISPDEKSVQPYPRQKRVIKHCMSELPVRWMVLMSSFHSHR